jgi:DNA-binding SARP family transcriptional activator
MPTGMRFGLLGPLTVRRGTASVAVTAGRQRAVLAALLLSAGRVVSAWDLADVLWGESAPPTAAASIRNYVKLLRQTLGDGDRELISTHPGGYMISVAPGDLDVAEFESLAVAGRREARAGSWEAAARQLAGALALWRGEPLADVDSEVLAARELPRLGELRLQALETRIDADLHLGRPGEVVAELRQLAGTHPLRERLHALLMLALYRDGRQAEALAAYQHARRLVTSELGAEPGPGLQDLHQQILTADPGLSAARPAGPGPAAEPQAGQPAPAMRYSLPPDTAVFTGREQELAAIAATGAVTAGPAGVIAIRAIGGMPGAGKTALAVRAAHLLAEEFPDRQLFVSLHGHTPGREPVSPEDALAGLLAATGVDPRFLPGDLEGRAALWRDRMAGQRVLLVLDNAASSAQVAPLLPGAGRADSGGCLALVTSRRHLGDLPGPVVPVLVGALPPERAAEMFTGLAPRAAGSPAEVGEVTRLAGFLPLAISLLARVHNRHPSWTLADLAAETRAGLLSLKAEDDSVAAAFGVSWRHLDPAARRFFRLLALHPGTTADAWAAAALAGVTVAEAAGLLDALHSEGLLTETAYRRYSMHDLLRRYARDQAGGGEGEEALGRLLDYYQRAAGRVRACLARQARPGPAPAAPAGPPAIPSLNGAGQAMAWARAERAGLVACLDRVARDGQDARLIALTSGVAELLRRDGPWSDAVAYHEAAVAAARRRGDRAAEARALGDLGTIRRLTDDFPAAARDLEDALRICRELGDRPGEAVTLNGLGIVRQQTAEYPAAVRDFGQALAIYRDLGDRLGEAGALRGLGDLRQQTGDYPAAARDLGQALAIYRDLGSRLGEGNALCGLGTVRRLTGDYPGAALAQDQALGIFREHGDRGGEAVALNERAAVHLAGGEVSSAEQRHRQARELARAIGSSVDEAGALAGLGRCALAAGHPAEAEALLGQALEIFQRIGAAAAGEVRSELAALRPAG